MKALAFSETKVNEQEQRLFVVRIAYWFGIAADALWAVGLFCPPAFGLLTGKADFNPDLQLRLVMGMAGTLMAGWTLLLLWAVREPIERRFVILVTAFPVVFGLSIVPLIGVLKGNIFEVWIVVKSSILFMSMITSYVLAGKMAAEERSLTTQ